jgi:formylglycine-generating enzyme required for sulfatase activity
MEMMHISMAEQIPDPGKRSFIYRLVQSFLDMVDEFKALSTERNVAPRQSQPRPDIREQLTELMKELRQLPSAYSIFLRTFDPPRTIDDLSGIREQDRSLDVFQPMGMLQASERLQAIGALVRADLQFHLKERFKRDELQAMCKARGLSRSGNMPDLAERLARADATGMWAAVGDWHLLKCTDLARVAARECLEHAPELVSDEPASADKKRETTTLRAAINWALSSAASGVIGNRADAELVKLATLIFAELAATDKSNPTAPQSPVPTPAATVESPLELSSPQRLPTSEPSRSQPGAIRQIEGIPFVYVPAGEFTMGSDHDREKPIHKVYLPAFWIMQTPVTNALYRAFVEASGYAKQDFWTPAGWQWRTKEKRTQPRYWGDKEWNQADYPVVGVSWYEAYAYARWLAHIAKLAIALPTEAQWEKAARGTDGRIYPWGNDEPNDQLLNYNNKIGHTTDVGSYPQGVSPYGCLDMAGNVWEWTSTLYKPYPYRLEDGREDPHDTGGRVLRGGSWYGNLAVARCTVRGSGSPDGSNHVFGLRLVSPIGSGS